MFTVLPFGLCSPPFIFTKVMHCPVKLGRLYDIKNSVFIYEGLGSSPTHDFAVKEAQIVKTFQINMAL